MKKRKNDQDLEAGPGAPKRSYWGLTIGTTLATGMIAMMLWLPPVFSARQMALAQAVRGSDATTAASPAVHGELISPPPNSPGVVASSAVPSLSATSARPISTASTTPAQARASSEADSKTDGYLDVGFDKLGAFKFEVTDEMVAGVADPVTTSNRISEQIPPEIKALNERQVAVRGFMLPLYVRHAHVTEFLLLRNQTMCCYGITPKMNEWIVVHAPGKGVRSVMDRTITVYGTLRVGESRENNALVGIYQLAGDRLDAPEIQ
jgi:hypothetical protein